MPTAIPKSSVTPYEPHHVQMWFQDPANANIGGWVAIPNLRCRSMRLNAQPYGGISSAVLTYDYGRIDLHDGAGWQTLNPLGESGSATDTLNPYPGAPIDVFHRFIRVNILNASTGLIESRWVGAITAVEDKDLKQPRSPDTDNDTVISRGSQQFTVSGPEWLLNRRQIVTSRADNVVPEAIPFNIRATRPSQASATAFGNSTTGPTYTFEDDLDNAIVWTGESILRYLTDFYLPVTLDAVASPRKSPQFVWSVSNMDRLAAFTPQLEAHGKTVYQLFNELADPKRFLNWAISYAPGGNDAVFGTWSIIFNTASSSAIALPNGSPIPANTRSIALNTSGTIDGHLSLERDASTDYAHVIVMGAKKGHVLSQQLQADELLKKDWTTAEETSYIDGVGAIDPEWAGRSHDQQQTLNRAYRTEQLSHVFRRFACPTSADFSAFTSENVYIPSLRWRRQTPLKENWDYTVDPPVAKASAKPQPETIGQFAVYKFATFESPEAWAKHNKLTAALKSDGISPEVARSIQLRPLDDAFGISLAPQQAHSQANGVSIPDDDDSETALFDYNTDIFFTGYFQENARVFGEWPTQTLLADNAATLVIRLGDVAFHDTLHANTIVGVEESQLIKSPGSDVVLRDDTEQLEDIARLAFEWYGAKRFAYQIRYAQILRDVEPGMIAVNIDGASADSLVTEVAYDLDNRQTSIATAYAEPDFTLLATQVLRA